MRGRAGLRVRVKRLTDTLPESCPKPVVRGPAECSSRSDLLAPVAVREIDKVPAGGTPFLS